MYILYKPSHSKIKELVLGKGPAKYEAYPTVRPLIPS